MEVCIHNTNTYVHLYFYVSIYHLGVPNHFNASCDNTSVGGTFILYCDFNDNSDAPATGVIVSLPGIIQDKLVSFNTIPVQHKKYTELVNIDLTYVTAGIYTLTLTAVNMIGKIIVFSSTGYIDGSKCV